MRQPAADTTGLEVLAAARPAGEIEMIAARIKRLLVDGDAAAAAPVRPGEIAVVFRHPQDAGGLLGEVFGRLWHSRGLESGPPLAREPAVVALLSAVAIARRRLAAAALLAVLGSNYFCPTGRSGSAAGPGAAVDRAIRRWQIPRGRRPLLDRLQAAAESEPRDRVSGTTSHRPWRCAVLGRLAAAMDELPERASPGAWGQGLAAIGPADRPAGSDENGTARSLTSGTPCSARPLPGHDPKRSPGRGLAASSATRPPGTLCKRPAGRRHLAAGSAATRPSWTRRGAGGAAGHLGQPAAQAGRRRGGPRAGPLGRQRPRAAGALSVPGRAGREGVSLRRSAKTASTARPSTSG